MSNELFETGGFTLDFFQFYNWGTFNNKIFTLNADNASTVLIGDNGSGKTTLVDALLTLLVPNEKRFYNQSAGEASKKDRSEETYVLGAFGNKLSGGANDNAYEHANYHRKKENTISILNGCFTNVSTGVSYTLLQVRYFTNSNIQQVYAISEGRITIERVQEVLAQANAEIVKSPRWKNVLSTALGTAFYPSFKQYVSAFSNYFGLRSDKALKLFSQIVGLKVLGDIDSFIKYNMLEEGNVLTEFDNLQDNYKTLVHCSNEIKKTKVQIEKFKAVNDNGVKFHEAEKRNKALNNLRDVVPFWYSKKANKFLTDDLEAKTLEEKKASETSEKLKREIDNLETEIRSLNDAISHDSSFIRLNEIKHTLAYLDKDKYSRQRDLDKFIEKLDLLNLKAPGSEEAFNNVREELNKKKETAVAKEQELAESTRALLNSKDELDNKISAIKAELASLGSRNSNIPTKNILIREQICEAVECDEETIPFVGELIEVKKEEKYWESAIEKVLHNIALTLIVPDSLYKKVSSYVNKTNMKGRVVYLQAEKNFFVEETQFEKNTIGTKLNFKETNEHCQWLKSYLEKNFSYVCSEDINEYSSNKKAVTAAGLIKSGLKNEKDDRPDHNKEANWVLGWNNKDKRTVLSNQLDNLEEQAYNLKYENDKIEKESRIAKQEQMYCHDALSIEKWENIDVDEIIKKIDATKIEENELIASNKSLEKLEKSLQEKEVDKRHKEESLMMNVQKIGSLSKEIDIINEDLTAINNGNLEYTTFINEQIYLLEKEFPKLAKTKSFAEVKSSNTLILKDLDAKIITSSNVIGNCKSALTKSMADALTPNTKIRELYGDWSMEFPDLKVSEEYLDDFIKVYERLEKDDLPKYTKKFHEYLHTSLKDDFTNFQRCIQIQQEEIKKAISALNEELIRITYNQNPDTYLQLDTRNKNDNDIREFNRLLKAASPNAMVIAQDNIEEEEAQFEKIQTLLNRLNNDEKFKKKVLDIRNNFTYGAVELRRDDKQQEHYYNSSSSISGGEKTKLTYTIVGAAISYQFGIAANNENKPSFKFVIIDEAFSKIDPKNSVKVMEILNELDMQIMAVTPVNNIDVIEDYVSTIHLVEKDKDYNSRLYHMEMKEYKEKKNDNDSGIKEEISSEI